MAEHKYLILRHNKPIGTLITPPAEKAALTHALTSAGYTVAERSRHPQAESIQRPDTKCTIEDHHPCDVSIAAGYLHQTAEALGLEDRALAKTLTEGYTDASIRKAMLHVRNQLHGIERQKADAAIQVAFPDHPIKK